jgi:hypothetical protein
MSTLRYVYVGALAPLVLATRSSDREDIRPRPTYAASRTTPGHAPSLDSITHVRLTLPESRTTTSFPRTPWVINEQRTVTALVDFVTRRDSLWRKTVSGAEQSSDPVILAHFHRGRELVATVALRMDQLGIEGQQGSFVQPLSFPDAATFLVLVGAPIKVIPVPPRDTIGRTL